MFNDSPAHFTAGDSVEFSVFYPDYHPDEGWSLNYVIAPVTGNPITITGEASGENHIVRIDPSASAVITPGRHPSYFVFQSGVDRKTIRNGLVLVAPDPTQGIPKTWAMETLTEVEVAIKKLAKSTNASVSVNGETYTKTDISRLVTLRNTLISEVAAELNAMGRGPARGGMRTIRTQFR